MFTQSVTYGRSGDTVRQLELPGYFVDYQEGGSTLCITFFAVDFIAVESKRDREPWGYDLIHRMGHSIVGVKPKAADWYRGVDLHQFFRSDAFAAFRAGFRRTILMGSSMGAYAALVFSDLGDDTEVLAYCPQSTVDPRVAPWERRWLNARQLDWTGDFSDAAIFARRARRLFVVYDPMCVPDRRHVDRLPTANLVPLVMPFVGHAVAHWLNRIGVLRELTERIFEGSLTLSRWNEMARGRRTLAQYYVFLGRATKYRYVAKACLEQLNSILPTEEFHLAYLMEISTKHDLAWLTAGVIRKYLAIHPTSEFAVSCLAKLGLQDDTPQVFAAGGGETSPSHDSTQPIDKIINVQP